jgi:pectate lyase
MPRRRLLRIDVVLLTALILTADCVYAAEPAASRQGEALVPEGFGAASRGGEGGRVIWVTTLKADGPGSFVEAIDATGPRIIKFKVAGEIDISKQKRTGNYFIWVGWPHRPQATTTPGGALNYDSPHSFVTVDGASAPEPGITFTNGGFYIGYGVHDVIIRHIRIKHGAIGGSSGDGMCIQAKRVLIDHCTITEAVDETIDMSGGRNVTVQWCVLGYGSKTSHPKGVDHSAGPFVAYRATRVSLHHNLIFRNNLRNPLLYGDYKLAYEKEAPPVSDVVNNTIFACHQGALVGAGMCANLVGNLYLQQHRPAIYIVTKYPGKPKVYLKDNIALRDGKACPAEYVIAGKEAERGEDTLYIATEPFEAAAVAAQPALDAAKLVLRHAGSRPWARSESEAALMEEVRKAGRF